jgi:hypothetical protein
MTTESQEVEPIESCPPIAKQESCQH